MVAGVIWKIEVWENEDWCTWWIGNRFKIIIEEV